jgi:carbon monoxide dehydrogenase subunit G
MQFTNAFEVSLPPAEAWPLLLDVQGIVPCMPGAELIEMIDDRTFKGKVSVKLGPVALAFVCNAAFEDVDATARRARISANGADSKGRGNAAAAINFRMQPSAIGAKVIIDTELNLSGAVAQYGRGAGMMQSVANQIVSQFAKNLEAHIGHLKQAGSRMSGDTAQKPLPPAGPAKPISGVSLIFASVRATIRGWFGRATN